LSRIRSYVLGMVRSAHLRVPRAWFRLSTGHSYAGLARAREPLLLRGWRTPRLRDHRAARRLVGALAAAVRNSAALRAELEVRPVPHSVTTRAASFRTRSPELPRLLRDPPTPSDEVLPAVLACAGSDHPTCGRRLTRNRSRTSSHPCGTMCPALRPASTGRVRSSRRCHGGGV
jgi:hypothetical protein